MDHLIFLHHYRVFYRHMMSSSWVALMKNPSLPQDVIAQKLAGTEQDFQATLKKYFRTTLVKPRTNATLVKRIVDESLKFLKSRFTLTPLQGHLSLSDDRKSAAFN